VHYRVELDCQNKVEMDAEYITSSKECALDQRTHQLQQELLDNQQPQKIPECPHFTLPGQEKQNEKPPNLDFEH
jgi:hypothetical protein